MRSNPNETFGSRVEDYVRPGSTVTFVIPQVQDHDTFVHEAATVLRDLLQFDVVAMGHDPHGGGSVLVAHPTKYPASIQRVNEALARVAERYNAGTCAWSWGPSNFVRPNHNTVVEHL